MAQKRPWAGEIGTPDGKPARSNGRCTANCGPRPWGINLAASGRSDTGIQVLEPDAQVTARLSFTPRAMS